MEFRDLTIDEEDTLANREVRIAFGSFSIQGIVRDYKQSGLMILGDAVLKEGVSGSSMISETCYINLDQVSAVLIVE
jgi:hypothetical protein